MEGHILHISCSELNVPQNHWYNQSENTARHQACHYQHQTYIDFYHTKLADESFGDECQYPT